MKTEKILWAIIILLVAAGVTTGVVLYSQNLQLARKIENTQPVTVPSVVEQKNIAPQTSVPLISARFQFGPLVSPDGQWFLAEDHWDNPDDIYNTVTKGTVPGYMLKHTLFLRNLYGQNEKNVVPQILEYRDRNSVAVPGYPQQKSWVSAGWSSDGQTVYFVTANSPGGNPARVNNAQMINGGKSLEAISIADGTQQTILKADDILKDSYIIDVYAPKNIALIIGKKVYLVNLDGTEKKELYTLQPTEQDAVGLFDSTGSHVAIAIGGDVSTGQDIVHCGKALKIIDLANLSIKTITTPDSCWSLVGWVNTDTLRVEIDNKETDITIK